MKVHIYKGNKIVEYADGIFSAFYMRDDEIHSESFLSLEAAQKFLDDNGYSVE